MSQLSIVEAIQKCTANDLEAIDAAIGETERSLERLRQARAFVASILGVANGVESNGVHLAPQPAPIEAQQSPEDPPSPSPRFDLAKLPGEYWSLDWKLCHLVDCLHQAGGSVPNAKDLAKRAELPYSTVYPLIRRNPTMFTGNQRTSNCIGVRLTDEGAKLARAIEAIVGSGVCETPKPDT